MAVNHVLKSILKKEFASYFNTPLGYVFLCIFVFGLGYLTFEPGRGSFFQIRQADMSPFFSYLPWMFLFLVPAVSMKLWAEERKSGTIELLFTLPVETKVAVVAKFFAAWLFVGLALVLTIPMIFTTLYLGSPDLKVIFCGYLGAFLMAGSLLAVCSFFSVMTKNQVVSFILSAAICMVLIMAGSPPALEFLSFLAPQYVVSLFESLSVLNHFESMGRGVLRLSDLWFFGLMICFWLVASISLLNENKAR